MDGEIQEGAIGVRVVMAGVRLTMAGVITQMATRAMLKTMAGGRQTIAGGRQTIAGGRQTIAGAPTVGEMEMTTVGETRAGEAAMIRAGGVVMTRAGMTMAGVSIKLGAMTKGGALYRKRMRTRVRKRVHIEFIPGRRKTECRLLPGAPGKQRHRFRCLQGLSRMPPRDRRRRSTMGCLHISSTNTEI
jgi:hypothetical protein